MLRRNVAPEDGFSLIEVLVTLVIGMIVLAAALTFMADAFTSSARVQDRHDSAGRARVTLDRATALLQAQVCNGPDSPIRAAGPTEVRFTATRGAVNAPPKGYVLRWDSADRTLVEEEYDLGTIPDSPGHYAWGPAITPKVTTIASRVVPETPGQPVFTFWGTADTLVNNQIPFNDGVGGAPKDADIPHILRVDVNLRVLPTRTKTEDDRTSALLKTSAYVASNIDPTKLDKGPQCS